LSIPNYVWGKKMKKENKVSRRSFAKTAAAGIVGLAVGAGIGNWLPDAVVVELTETGGV